MRTGFIRRTAVIMAFVASVILAPVSARAAALYDFVFTPSGLPATPANIISGTFEVDGTLIVGITGTAFGGTITELVSVGEFLGNDSMFSATSPYVSRGGVAFISNGGARLIYWDPDQSQWVEVDSSMIRIFGTLRVTAASVPEPATLALFGVGLVGLAALRRRRRA